MDMRFVIPSRNLKVFSKIIQCMAKIGDDLFLDVKTDKLVMRTLNNARSAFVSISFSKNFFEYFSAPSDGDRKYQMKAKPCHAVFHNINNAEKCTIRLDEEEQRLVFDLPCKRGIKKTSKLAFEQCEPLQAIYQKENCGNRIVARPKQLSDNLPNFHSHLDEITMFVSKDGLRIKSYTDDAKGANAKILQTELHMDANDFEEFSIEGKDMVDVTFSLKEFKSIIGLCEVIGQPCSLLIEKGGRPMLITMKYFNLFEADFVLATLVSHTDVPSSQNSTSSADSSAYSPSPINITPKQKPTPSPMSPMDARSPMSHHSHSSNHSPSGPSPMSYDANQDMSPHYSSNEQRSNPRRSFTQAQQGDQDEYVSGSPQASPKKMQKVDALSRMLGGRDLDAEYDEDYEMMDDNGDTIPSSAS